MVNRIPPSRCAIAACALLALAGCDQVKVSIDGHSGVPLAQLDLNGRTAHEITLLGPDTVHIVPGATLAITVSGDPRAAAALRFVLNDGKLGIGRQPDLDFTGGTAIVTITDPAPDHLVMAGSGTITSTDLRGSDTGVTIAGSGNVTVPGIAAKALAVEVLGTGNFGGGGHVDKLTLTIAGTGNADLAQLSAGTATVDLAGTGSGTIASDGKVTGSINGTGQLVVHGKAQCTVEVNGTGQVTCAP